MDDEKKKERKRWKDSLFNKWFLTKDNKHKYPSGELKGCHMLIAMYAYPWCTQYVLGKDNNGRNKEYQEKYFIFYKKALEYCGTEGQKCGTEMYTIESLLPLKANEPSDFTKILAFMKKTIRDRSKAMIEWNKQQQEKNQQGYTYYYSLHEKNRFREWL